MEKNRAIGSSFDSFLQDENILAETEAVATKRVLAYQMEQAIKEMKPTKTGLAKRMNTSRAAVNRMLDPNSTFVTLASLESAALALGRNVRIELV